MDKQQPNLFYINIMVLLFIVSAFSSCKEVGPDIDLGNNNVIDTTLIDTTYVLSSLPAAQQKVVLIEDFTGVRCINCPDAHEQAAAIENANAGKVVSISLHSDFLGVAYTGQPELRIPEAQQLEELLGPAPAKPVGAIDRTLFSGETSLLLFLQQWAGRTNELLNQSVAVNIELENIIESTDTGSNLLIKTTLTYLQNVSEENRITLLVAEKDVVAAQLTASGVDSNYVHKNVARAFLTRYNGNVLNYNKEAGRVIVKEFRLPNIPASWKLNDLIVIAFVHQSGSSQKVLHTAVKNVL
jgi:hypothetical protein